MTLEIQPFADDVGRLDAIIAEARAEGFTHMDRLADNWRSGANRFALAGEALLACCAGDLIVGVGGLNRDPFLNDPNVGRLRHIYVMNAYRRAGVGRRLVEALLARARGAFGLVRVRAARGDANLFYDALGFERVEKPDVTHVMRLDGGA